MIYIGVTQDLIAESNQYVIDNIDPTAENTFIVNMENVTTGVQYAVISLPDNHSTYNNKMVRHFGIIDISELTPTAAVAIDDAAPGEIPTPVEVAPATEEVPEPAAHAPEEQESTSALEGG
jgi:hypothetical protein